MTIELAAPMKVSISNTFSNIHADLERLEGQIEMLDDDECMALFHELEYACLAKIRKIRAILGIPYGSDW